MYPTHRPRIRGIDKRVMNVYRAFYALVVNSVLTSGVGVLYWVLAARLYGAGAVGANSAILSAMFLIAGFAQIGLNPALLRFIPAAGRATRRLTIFSFLIISVPAAGVGTAFIAGIRRWLPGVAPLFEEPALRFWFVIATVAWAMFSMADSVLTGVRKTRWVVLKNTFFAVAKIAVLVALARADLQTGIFLSWSVVPVVTLVPMIWWIFARVMPKSGGVGGEGAGSTVVDRHIVTFVGASYLAQLFQLLCMTLVPLMVTNRLGPAANGRFYIAWTVMTSLQLIGSHMCTAFVVEASANRHWTGQNYRRALTHAQWIVAPVTGLIAIASPLILKVFGADYGGAATVLRLLSLSVIPNTVVTMYLGLSTVRNDVGRIVLVQVILSSSLLVASYFALAIAGIDGIGWVWLVLQTSIATCLFMATARNYVRFRSSRDSVVAVVPTNNEVLVSEPPKNA